MVHAWSIVPLSEKDKNTKKYLSLDFDSDNRENSILLQKLKNIQIQTSLIKDELKKYGGKFNPKIQKNLMAY